MSLSEYINANAPITNIPDLLGWHHSNPLGIDIVAQLIIIFLVVEVMAFINYRIRHKGADNLYPVLYALLGVSLAAVYYYCFQADLVPHRLHSTIYAPDLANMPADVADVNHANNAASAMVKPTIGWFCYPEIVGWPLAVLNVVLLTHVIYSILSAYMQVAAQLSVEINFINGKPWKEWKSSVIIILVGVLACSLTGYISNVATSWTLLAFFVIITLFVIGKIIADAVRSHKPYYSFLIGLTCYVGIIACLMLSLECLRGGIFFIVILAAFLGNAKARKKKGAQPVQQ